MTGLLDVARQAEQAQLARDASMSRHGLLNNDNPIQRAMRGGSMYGSLMQDPADKARMDRQMMEDTMAMMPMGGVLKGKKLRKIWGKMGSDGKKAFANLANSQRGEPEIAMLQAQYKTPGVMSYMLEHIGDLTHRMSEGAKWGFGQMHTFAGGMGREMVTEKLNKTLNTLKSGYGFRREFNENMINNAKRNNISETKQWELADKRLKKYVDEHKKLPVYNEAQWLGREAAISLGEKKFDRTIEMLERLQQKTNNQDKWFVEATKVVRDKSSGGLLQYKPSNQSNLLGK